MCARRHDVRHPDLIGRGERLVSLERSGGRDAIPGLSTRIDVETSTLSPDQATALEGLVHRLGLLDAVEEAGQPVRTVPDARHFIVTVDDGDACRRRAFHDPLPSPDHAELVHLLESSAHLA